MQHAALDQVVPDFELPSTGNTVFRLFEQQGKNIVIYFYPKDNTPGCTLEGQNFRDHIDAFTAKDTIIVGVSRDSVRVHEGFKAKQSFPFELLSDKEELACKVFDVIQLKKNYGREYMGIVRSTFLIDKTGVLRQEWRNVKVKTHLEEVLDAVNAL
jgi:thioredoxin-dependent peroxiredoxin